MQLFALELLKVNIVYILLICFEFFNQNSSEYFKLRLKALTNKSDAVSGLWDMQFPFLSLSFIGPTEL